MSSCQHTWNSKCRPSGYQHIRLCFSLLLWVCFFYWQEIYATTALLLLRNCKARTSFSLEDTFFLISVVFNRSWVVIGSDTYWSELLYMIPCRTRFTLGNKNTSWQRGSWGPSGADRTQVGPVLTPWTMLSGQLKLIWYKTHQIPKLKCFSSRLAAVFAQSIETRC